jgi:hypothetical protein
MYCFRFDQNPHFRYFPNFSPSEFLTDSAKCTLFGLSAMYVRHFMKCVRFVQRNMKSFVACKKARAECIGLIWDNIEKQFIQVFKM